MEFFHESHSLGVCVQLPNVYFLELKDLSNPKFLDWLKKQDEDWESVIKIPHRNKSSDFDKKPILKPFWKEYNEGLILQDKVLVSPLSKKYPPKSIIRILEQEQELIDFIRKNHERYLRFDLKIIDFTKQGYTYLYENKKSKNKGKITKFSSRYSSRNIHTIRRR